MRPVKIIPVLVTLLVLIGSMAAGDQSNGIDPEAIIERILSVEEQWRQSVKDVVFDAEYVSGEMGDDGNFTEKTRFEKKTYLKFLPDTALYYEEYLAYFKEGEKQSDDDLLRESEDMIKKKKKRKGRDISYPMLEPFYPDNRDAYNIEYVGVPSEQINGMVCHHFKVTAVEEDPDKINGDFFFDANSFNVVKVDFTPSKKGGGLGFKVKKLDMSITYGPSAEGVWLPQQFDIYLKAKAILFIPVTVHGTEYYRNPVVNGGIDDKLFEAKDDE